MPPDVEAIAEQVFAALADPTRRTILATLAADGPTTATDLADRQPITRPAIAKHRAHKTEGGLVKSAQQFLAALARDWDRSLDTLTAHLERSARERPA